MKVVIYWNPTCLPVTNLIPLKATLTLSIYFLIESLQYLFLFPALILYDLFTDFDILIQC